ncbi:heavy-metal-associated domain-containing protein [Pelagibius marinus]|uniref:heavy-metal-associated domain-containing protein n=1 Tax=Pelagibius marinus TaxID=2762760 RepID=UPI001872BB23|nr:heavy-metal-associated domain-containing protein [Pelagibius marinus]
MCDSHQHHEAETTATAASKGISFHVADMTCGHCAGVIRSALEESLPGTAIEIDIAKAQVTVAGDQAKAAQAIREAGYTPELLAH